MALIYAVRRYASFTGHLNTSMHVVELPDGVGIGIDAWLLSPKPFKNNVVQRFGGSAGSESTPSRVGTFHPGGLYSAWRAGGFGLERTEDEYETALAVRNARVVG
jgi:hypothetical protein